MFKENYMDIIRECSEGLPQFSDGRIDFSDASIIPVVNVIVAHDDEVLLLKRSSKVLTNKNKWDCIGGYLDEIVSPEEKALSEAREEIGISKGIVRAVFTGEPFNIIERHPQRRWIVFPVLLELSEKPKIVLDEEHVKHAWVKRDKIDGFAQAKKVRNVLFACTIAGKGDKA